MLRRVTPPFLSTGGLQRSSLFYKTCRCAHTVNVILKEDLPDGKGYKNDLLPVKPGYMRNYLYPKGLAVYATNENRLQYGHPEGNRAGGVVGRGNTIEEENDDADASVDGSDVATEHRRSADLLSSYMKGKQITVKRNFKNDKVSPGVVNGAVLEEKLQEQFRVFLDGEKEWIGVKRDSKRPEYQEGVKKSKSTAEGEDLILAEGEHEVFVNLEGGMQVPLSVNVVRR